jgi:hypothetical protein
MAVLNDQTPPDQWQPYREPLRNTILRTGIIAVVAGAALARPWARMARWPMATLLMLWPSFGGHWVEVWFLNWLRPRLENVRSLQVAARIGTWFVGGAALFAGMTMTAAMLGFRLPHWPAWMWGIVFVGVELVAHLALLMTGRPNFYTGLG